MRLVAAASVLLLLASGCAGTKNLDEDATASERVPAPPGPLDRYAYKGTSCVELGLFVPVMSSNLRPHVPAQYKLVGESQGRGVLAFAFARCDAMTVPGSSGTVRVFQVDVSASIENPDGGPPIAYEIAFLTTNGTIAQNVARAGFPARDASNSSLTYTLAPTEAVQAHVRADDVQMTVDATATRGPAAGPSGGTYIHADEHATSRMVYSVALSALGPAKGVVTAPSGTLVARLMGASSAEATGFFGSFSLDAELTRTAR